MEAERQEHLEAMVSSDEPEDREAHRIIALWLKQFFDKQGRQAELVLEHKNQRSSPETLVGSEYMSPDSDYDTEE
jgi:hypothetical protein